MKRFFALLLIAVLVLSVAGCKFSIGNVDPGDPNQDPGADPGPDPSADPDPDPGSGDGKWRTVDGEFYTFSQDVGLGFLLSFRELEFTYSDQIETYAFRAIYLGDEEVLGQNARRYALTANSDDLKGDMDFWITEAGEVIQVGALNEEGVLETINNDPYTLEWWTEEWVDTLCTEFIWQHSRFEGYHLGDIYTDPSVFAAFDDLQVNEVGTRKADLGAGMVTIHYYDYGSEGNYATVEEIAKIGDKYLFISSTTSYAGSSPMELKVTRAVPF
ncbi:MAG: hypothetical protein ACOX2G_06165 [Bacillota bacterium]